MSRSLACLASIALAGGVFVSVAASGPAAAQSARPNSTTMTCAQVQALIDRSGALLLSTGPHTFDRYVANASQCARGEYLRRDYVPTRDTDRCFAKRCDPGRPFPFD